MTTHIQNAWKNISFTPAKYVKAKDVPHVKAIVDDAKAKGQKVKVVGGGHSMNHIFRTDGILVDLSELNLLLSANPVSGVVQVEAGLTLGAAIEACKKQGLHFPSLGSWYSQSIAGAIATSTHGSSLKHGSLSDIVIEVDAVLADGTVRTFSGTSDEARAMRCHLGQLGIVTKVKLKLDDAFSLRCKICTQPAPDAFQDILATARSEDYVNMLWIPDIDVACTRILTRQPPCDPNGEATALESRFVDKWTITHRILDIASFLDGHFYLAFPRWRWLNGRYSRRVENAFCEDRGVIDTSYRVFLYDQYREPTENHHLRMIMNVEYAFDTEQLVPLLTRLRTELEQFRREEKHLHYPRIHVRFAPKSDATLIGLNADRETAYVGIYVVASIRHQSQIEIAKVIEEIFVDFEGRPHWGKYSYLQPQSFSSTYTNLAQFETVRNQIDKNRMFSDGKNMFQDLNKFAWGPTCGALLRGVFDPKEYPRTPAPSR